MQQLVQEAGAKQAAAAASSITECMLHQPQPVLVLWRLCSYGAMLVQEHFGSWVPLVTT